MDLSAGADGVAMNVVVGWVNPPTEPAAWIVLPSIAALPSNDSVPSADGSEASRLSAPICFPVPPLELGKISDPFLMTSLSRQRALRP